MENAPPPNAAPQQHRHRTTTTTTTATTAIRTKANERPLPAKRLSNLIARLPNALLHDDVALAERLLARDGWAFLPCSTLGEAPAEAVAPNSQRAANSLLQLALLADAPVGIIQGLLRKGATFRGWQLGDVVSTLSDAPDVLSLVLRDMLVPGSDARVVHELVNAPSEDAGLTPLMHACGSIARPRVVDMLVRLGARFDVRSPAGLVAADYASLSVRLFSRSSSPEERESMRRVAVLLHGGYGLLALGGAVVVATATAAPDAAKASPRDHPGPRLHGGRGRAARRFVALDGDVAIRHRVMRFLLPPSL